MREILARLGRGGPGPMVLAVALAIIATPFVAMSFLAPPIFEVDAGFQPPGILSALVIAAVASIGAAVVAGAVAGLLVRLHPTLGALLALGIAWPVAVSLVPAAAVVLGIPFETAYSCFDTCGPSIHSRDALSGGGAYLVSAVLSLVTIVPPIILAVCLYFAYKLNQTGYPFAATVVLGIGYMAMHWVALLGGGPPLIAFVCLLVGVATWTSVLRGPSPSDEAGPAPT